jgi:PilZ domain
VAAADDSDMLALGPMALTVLALGIAVVVWLVLGAKGGSSSRPLAPQPAPAEPGAEFRVERRAFPRRPVVRPVTVRRGGPDGAATRCFAFNIAPGGVLLSGPASLVVGETVWLELDLLDGARPVHASGAVVHEMSNGHKGVRFDMVVADDRDMLDRCCQAPATA